MTLNDIITRVLQNTQWPTDAQTTEELRDIIVPFINDGYREACERYRPFTTETVVLDDESCFDLFSLNPPLRRVLAVMRSDSNAKLRIDTPESKRIVKVFGVPAGEMVHVKYEFIPRDLFNDADIPIIPVPYHGILADFATFKYLITQDITAQSKAGVWKQAFDQGIARLTPEFDIPEQRRIRGKYGV